MLVTNNRGEKMEFISYDGIITYKNPFGEVNKKPKPDYERRNPFICEVEGGMLIQVYHNQYDFLVNGEVVTQRVGASVELLELMIKEGLKALDYTHKYQINQKLDNKKMYSYDKNISLTQNLLINGFSHDGIKKGETSCNDFGARDILKNDKIVFTGKYETVVSWLQNN